MSLQNASSLMNKHLTCVVATVSEEGLPEAATVGFSHDKDFSIVIATNEKTRKAQNLVANKHVAMVIGFEGLETVQIEGKAAKKTAVELGDRLEQHFAKVPNAKKRIGNEGEVYFLITPTWLRHTDYTAEQPVFETKDFS